MEKITNDAVNRRNANFRLIHVFVFITDYFVQHRIFNFHACTSVENGAYLAGAGDNPFLESFMRKIESLRTCSALSQLSRYFILEYILI